jgi:DNA polymerase elongation subunit (family B)
VIEKGSAAIAGKSRPVQSADLKRIDTDYYLKHQELPASLRILKVLGVDEERLQ